MFGIRWEANKYALQPVSGHIGDARLLMDDPRFRDVSEAGSSYLDYVGVLSVEEAVEMAKSDNDEIARSRTPKEVAAFKLEERLDKFKKSLEGVQFVVIHIYEWESGLG